MTLSEQARTFQLLADDLPGFREFITEVIPVIEEHEKRQELIRAFNAANKPGQIIAVPDERAERRTLAIAQMAASLIAESRLGTWPERIESAINASKEILAEVEKRG